MLTKLPNELIANILALVGKESSLDLKPLTLVGRQWHAVVAPSLLSIISVSSLGNLAELCDFLHSKSNSSEEGLPLAVFKNTKTIVISGKIWPAHRDCHVGLEDLGEVGEGENEDTDDPAEPDVSLSFDEISSKLRAGLPLLAALDGLEWYGRFAGDYHLVRYLQKANIIRHLAYGIDMQVSGVSLAYRENAFRFDGLKTLKITSEYEPEGEIFPFITDMMHRNHDLEEILFDCKFAETMSGQWSLDDVICKDQQVFVWPNLRSLVLRFFKGAFWQSAEQVNQLADFLVAHPLLETLVLRETCLEDSESETALPLSLAAHPSSLPALKLLHGSARLIAGVLESSAACSSVTIIVDNSEVGFDADGAKTPYINRIVEAFQNTPENSARRIELEVPQLNRDWCTKLASVVPKVRSVGFLKDLYVGATSISRDPEFNPLDDIPAFLNAFPNLEIVGQDIAKDFCKALEQEDGETALIELAKRVPHLNAVYCDEGTFLVVSRDSVESLSISKEPVYFDNSGYTWNTFEVDWRHRPLSRRKIYETRRSYNHDFESLVMRFSASAS
ncbi:26S proteasome non-ATPase regulatory subunit 12 [Ceratobasidium sp. AG-Ba]|nr:26S proteasome non-ATPase regulatory subunit 12 [Ceratobasidium sp. AG-Ba]